MDFKSDIMDPRLRIPKIEGLLDRGNYRYDFN